MKLLSYWRSVGAKLFHSSRLENDLEDELRSHIEHRADDLQRSGLDHAAAEHQARIEFGGHVRFREESREALGANLVETVIQDVRVSARVLRKSPSFTTVAVLTLAFAIGANAVVFAVLNAMILRPLDVPQPESLYTIEHQKGLSLEFSYPDYLDLRDHNRSFEGLAAYNNSQAGLDTGGNPSRAFVDEVTANYFDLFGIQPYLGRFFHSSDEHGANTAPYIVLNYAYWQTHFQADRAVLGRTVQLNKHPFTIIGVAPPGFHGPVLFFSQDLFVPIGNVPQLEGGNLNDRGFPSLLMTIGHLKAGVTKQQAIGDLNSIGSYLEKAYPKTDAKMSFRLAHPFLFGDFAASGTRAFLTSLMLLAGLILLAACANLGSLFAARAADRSRELAMRLALGAGRSRLLRGLLSEALLLSLIGGAVGLCGGAVLLSGLSLWRPIPRYPVQLAVHPDANVYAVAVLLTILSGFLFGAVPVRQVFRTDPYEVVKSASGTTRAMRTTIRDLLLGVQIAICALLITSSLVAVRGMMRSLHSRFGFDPNNALLMDTDLTMAGYRGDAVAPMQRRLIDAIGSIPGVTSVGLADLTPLNGSMQWSSVFSGDATDLTPSNAALNVPTYRVSPNYFSAARTALLSGRDFTWHDDKNAPRVAVINEEFARRLFWSAESASGRYFRLPDGARVQVVGIAEDGKYQTIGEDQQPAMFLSILQSPSSGTTLLVRSNRDIAPLPAIMRSKLRGLDSGLPSFIQTWDQGLRAALFAPRMATISLGVLGVIGAMLSITGVFGMAAYSVTKRLKELGIRLALGAQRKEMLEAALGRAIRLLAVGSIAGLLLGVAASRVLSAIVYQATPRDPLVLAGVVVAMSLLGLMGTWVPAQRALALDPAALLREE